jgi:SsrA-binding protein
VALVLFTAADLGKFAEMMLRLGAAPDGVKLFNPYTVRKFTEPQTPMDQPTLRALGWDMDSRYSGNRGELFLINCNISPYSAAYQARPDEATRSRKLLIHRRELNRLVGDISRKGITVVPLRMYFNDRNIAKVELGFAKHKKAHSKKETIKERDIARETRRELKDRG